MNEQKALLIGSVVVAATVAAIALTQAKEEPTPSGELRLEVWAPEPYSVDEVQGQASVAALVRLTGKALSGVPAPDMTLELYDNGVLRASSSFPGVDLNVEYTLDENFVSPADLGSHDVYGVLTLTNEVGTIQYQTVVSTFVIGEAPTGEITITVTEE